MTQEHIIKKQVLDITLDSEIGSFTFQSKVSELFNAEIVPLIDSYCNEIDSGQGVRRIDRLEIDLGRLDKHNFAGDFKSKFIKFFPEKLMEAVDAMGGHSSGISSDGFNLGPSVIEITRDIELLEFFIKEGRLPWWVKRGEAYDIPALLELYLAKEPLKIKRIMTRMAGNTACVKRLVNLATDPVLEKIVALFEQQYSQKICILSRYLIAGLSECHRLDLYNLSRIKAEVWTAILSLVATSNKPVFNLQLLLPTVIGHISKTAGVDYAELYSYMVSDLIINGVIEADEAIVPDISHIRAKGLEFTAQPVLFGTNGSTITEYIHQFEVMEKLLNELQFGLWDLKPATDVPLPNQPILDNLIHHLLGITQIIHNVKDLMNDTGGKKDTENILTIKLNGKNEPLESQVRELTNRLAELQEDLSLLSTESLFTTDNGLVKKLVESMAVIQNTPVKERDSEIISAIDIFADSQEIFIHNAGLVLLWPYLPMFLESLGLIENNRFRDEDARERAVFLLHYLAFGAGETPEYHLMLNKILCGIDPEAPLQPFFTINETEIVKCENLLQSAIYNWPVLRNVTIPGLRSMFLKREGIISTRDGHWLLRIEEQAHDILLDKMPWGINTVKLPWMPELLFVEWRL